VSANDILLGNHVVHVPKKCTVDGMVTFIIHSPAYHEGYTDSRHWRGQVIWEQFMEWLCSTV